MGSASAPAGAAGRPTPLRGRRILVVDDDNDMLDLLTLALEQAGAQVRTARSAAEARLEVYGSMPHVVITDLAMPLENGLCVLRDILALRPHASHPVRTVLLTAYGDPATRLTAEGLGFDLVLSKPIEPCDIVRHIAATLGR